MKTYEEALRFIQSQGDTENVFGIAAGMLKTPEDVKEVMKIPGKKVRVGSITVPELTGNEEPTYADMGTYSVNSVGLKNGGLPYYRDKGMLVEIVHIIHEAGKKCVLSVLANTPEQLIKLYFFAIACKVDEVELNFSCPNRWEKHTGKQEPLICFSPRDTEIMLAALYGAVLHNKNMAPFRNAVLPTWVKISLFTDYAQLEQIALTISRYKDFIVGVVSANTGPNGWAHREHNHLAIPRPSGVAGSDAFRALVLGNVDFLRQVLPQDMLISGVGGIDCASHAIEYFMHGASEVQIATAYKNEGGVVFHRIARQFANILEVEEMFKV